MKKVNEKISEETNLDDFEVISRNLIQGKDLNPFGNVFGGQMLSWLDESSYIYLVTKTGYSNFVTVNMNDVNFHAPAKLGDVITFYGKIIRTGKSSATVRNRAFVHEVGSDLKKEIINCTITFVALKNGKSFPFFTKKDRKK
ncbi:MAG: acyl-CoA thioesterase [Spirochaetia bacterium]|nr:acyl-CoA thioesterase [Spirochaetia bacterium]